MEPSTQYAAQPNTAITNAFYRNTTVSSVGKLPFLIPHTNFPIEIAHFAWNLAVRIVGRNSDALRRLYEADFNTLSEQYYSTKPWPDADAIAEFYKQNDCYQNLIEAFYQELYFKHLFAKCKGSVKFSDRSVSWGNYVKLFDYFTDQECASRVPDASVGLILPNQWVWGLHDEFVYQFQDFSHWKVDAAKEAIESGLEDSSEFLSLKENPDIWSTPQVLQILHQLVDASGITDLLGSTNNDFSHGGQYASELNYQLGYYAMISLLRCYTLMGEYSLAIDAVSSIEISPRSHYTKVFSCYACFAYHLGFSYMMLRRYTDAANIFSQYLLHVAKQRNSPQGRMPLHASKQADRIYLLLLLCEAVSNIRIDDAITVAFREKSNTKQPRLQPDSLVSVTEMFTLAQPKVIVSTAYPLENSEMIAAYANAGKEKAELHQQSFLAMYNHERKLADINSFAKLYNNVHLAKLGSFVDPQDEKSLENTRAEALAIKHRTRQLIHRSGSLLEGDMTIILRSFDFFVDDDILHVKNQRVNRIYTEDFSKAIVSSQELLARIESRSSAKVYSAE